jgi:hypothetical protein
MDPTDDPLHAALYLARDWKFIGMLTGTTLDCRLHITSAVLPPWGGLKYSKTERKGGRGQGGTRRLLLDIST